MDAQVAKRLPPPFHVYIYENGLLAVRPADERALEVVHPTKLRLIEGKSDIHRRVVALAPIEANTQIYRSDPCLTIINCIRFAQSPLANNLGHEFHLYVARLCSSDARIRKALVASRAPGIADADFEKHVELVQSVLNPITPAILGELWPRKYGDDGDLGEICALLKKQGVTDKEERRRGALMYWKMYTNGMARVVTEVTARANDDGSLETAKSQSVPCLCFYRFGSMFNHSCAPNAMRIWAADARNASLGPTMLSVRTTTDIEAGEEITISYEQNIESMSFEERQKALLYCGFTCQCPKCQERK